MRRPYHGVLVAPTVGVPRSRLISGIAGALAVVGVSTWLFAAEDRGALPPGHYEASPVPDWPVTPEHADAIRRDALARAAVRLDAPTNAARAIDPLDRSPVTCRFLSDAPSGTSAKFDCVLERGRPRPAGKAALPAVQRRRAIALHGRAVSGVSERHRRRARSPGMDGRVPAPG